MTYNALKLASDISDRAPTLIAQVMRSQYKRHPELEKRYGAAGKQHCREDLEFHFSTLAEAIASEEPALFLKYVSWGKVILISRKIRTDDFIDTLYLMQEVISRNVPTRAANRASRYLQEAIDRFDELPSSPPSHIDLRAPLSKLASSYLQALLSVDRNEARKLIRASAKTGTRYEDIFRYVFEPVQREIGRLWQMNHISVAEEHYCTATTEQLISEALREREEIDRGPHFFLGACVAGSHHSLGIRMFSELLEMNGWKVYFTGANTPSSNLVDLVRRFHIDVLGISATTPMDLAHLRGLIESIRSANHNNTRIMVGGRVFCEFPALWKKVGADAFSHDAVSGVAVARKLVSSNASRAKKKSAGGVL